MKTILRLFIVLLSIGWISSCTTTEIREVEKVYYKTVYKENPFYIEDSTLSYFRDSFVIDQYTYSGSNLYDEVAKWVNSLPQKIRDSLFSQKLLIQK
ncbi:hypothetical protein [Aureispira anguillae]|uniref:DUF4296 domain-containing protein n=1 Tax=Aureispira anguillae TaxID=2864201 RepID=A0A916DUF6_9BACT|nr:hypothetical protein [Aureispira anguillae]BDS12490.1 hypothetical protein AsAng_0032130 [Aureispira anguillae]